MEPIDPDQTCPPSAPATIPAPPPDMTLTGHVVGPLGQAPLGFTVHDFDGFASEDLDEEG